MKSIWNPNRFLRSVKPWYWGNAQPTKTQARVWQARLFKPWPKQRKIKPRAFFIPRSSGMMRSQ